MGVLYLLVLIAKDYCEDHLLQSMTQPVQLLQSNNPPTERLYLYTPDMDGQFSTQLSVCA